MHNEGLPILGKGRSRVCDRCLADINPSTSSMHYETPNYILCIDCYYALMDFQVMLWFEFLKREKEND